MNATITKMQFLLHCQVTRNTSARGGAFLIVTLSVFFHASCATSNVRQRRPRPILPSSQYKWASAGSFAISHHIYSCHLLSVQFFFFITMEKNQARLPAVMSFGGYLSGHCRLEFCWDAVQPSRGHLDSDRLFAFCYFHVGGPLISLFLTSFHLILCSSSGTFHQRGHSLE